MGHLIPSRCFSGREWIISFRISIDRRRTLLRAFCETQTCFEQRHSFSNIRARSRERLDGVCVCVCVCVDPRLPDVMDIATPANQADAAIER
jgi:hypothetical protein